MLSCQQKGFLAPPLEPAVPPPPAPHAQPLDDGEGFSTVVAMLSDLKGDLTGVGSKVDHLNTRMDEVRNARRYMYAVTCLLCDMVWSLFF